MIPIFPEFKSLELSDRLEMERMTSQFPPYSDFNFTSMWSWNLVGEIAISNLNNNLVVRFTDYVTNAPFYSFIGVNEVNDTVEKLLKFSVDHGLPAFLRLIPEDVSQYVDINKFSVVEDRDHFDYIYSISELKDYPGGKFSKKRNHVNGFLQKYPNVEAKQISLKDKKVADEVLELFDKWHRFKIQKEVDSGLHDLAAMKRMLEGVEVFELVNVGVYIENKLVALFINQLINQEYVLAHMMKADLTVDDGVYAYLMQKNAEILSKYNVTLFNYEQDLGIENLRIAKTRFRPVSFLKKYKISYTQQQ